MKKILALIFLFVVFLPAKANAIADHLVINELLPLPSGDSEDDWIELYNPTPGDVDIGGWILRDTATTKIRTFPAGTMIESHDFIFEYVSNRLGNSGDTISLIMPDDSQVVDSKIYSGVQVAGVSIGRLPDGEDNWVTFNTPTPGSSNNPSSPTPTPTTIPTGTPTAIPTPTPSLEPTPTPTPTATVMPTSTPEPTVLPSPSSTVRPTPTPINIHEILEERMTCRFSYDRFSRIPNSELLISLIKSIFGPNSVCHTSK